MAYCLRALPLDATRLIDEMCSQWRALAVLKAAGGTPTARCMKDVSVVAKHYFVEIRALNSRVYLRKYIVHQRRCAACTERDPFSLAACERCPNPHTYQRVAYAKMEWGRLNYTSLYWSWRRR